MITIIIGPLFFVSNLVEYFHNKDGIDITNPIMYDIALILNGQIDQVFYRISNALAIN